MAMEVAQVLHMKGGLGKTSYASNSSLQRTVISMVKPMLEESIVEFYRKKQPECMVIADLGCSAGPNTLLVISEIMDIIVSACEKLGLSPPSLQAFLNDLPGNDFNSVFMSWPSFKNKLMEEYQKRRKHVGECYIAGVPGSFYSSLFPDNSLHFVHSSYALMWISEAPKVWNKENICIAKTSGAEVQKAYLDQFQRDFTMFLKCRARELVCGGQMLLTTMGSLKSDDPLSMWEFVGMKLHDLVLLGVIEEKSLENFNLPYYAATMEEMKKVIEAEGSFTLQRIEAFKMDWDSHTKIFNPLLNKKERSAKIAGEIRAVGEPMLKNYFGEEVVERLFEIFEEEVIDYMEMHRCKYINVVLSLKKRDSSSFIISKSFG